MSQNLEPAERVDAHARAVIDPLLHEGETLVWAEPMNARRLFPLALWRGFGAACLALFAAAVLYSAGELAAQSLPEVPTGRGPAGLMGGVFLHWAVWARLPIAMALFAAAFVLLRTSFRVKRTCYALTNQRIIAASATANPMRISIPLAHVVKIARWGDEAEGSIGIYAAPNAQTPAPERAVMVLPALADAKAVEAALLSALRAR